MPSKEQIDAAATWSKESLDTWVAYNGLTTKLWQNNLEHLFPELEEKVGRPLWAALTEREAKN